MVSLQQIKEAATVIQNGGTVAFPTETVYGLGANALNAEAVAKIFMLKERPSFDPLIVHIASVEDIPKLTDSDDSRILEIASHFWPGPLTIVLPKKKIVPDIVTSGLPTVGLRMPANDIALDLIKQSGCPIAAPSANKFGKISPTKANHVLKQISGIDCILDGGATTVGIESTVIAIYGDGFRILREGLITREQLLKIIPESQTAINNGEKASPGLMNSHYSPDKPIFLMSAEEGKEYAAGKGFDLSRGAFISFYGNMPEGYLHTEILSHNGNLKEAAVNLFGCIHNLEDNNLIDFIIAEPVPETGIGRAIMDRLKKASFRYRITN